MIVLRFALGGPDKVFLEEYIPENGRPFIFPTMFVAYKCIFTSKVTLSRKETGKTREPVKETLQVFIDGKGS